MLFRSLAIFLTLLAGSADGSTTQPVPAIRQWVLDLGSLEPDVRSAARGKLLGLSADDLTALRAAVADGAANLPCQADVLYDVVRHVYLSGIKPPGSPRPPSFLGLRLFQGSTLGETPMGLSFQQRIMGYPAFAAFEEGDALLSVDELPDSYLVNYAALKDVRDKVPPGTPVHFRILRDDRVRSVEITLSATPPPESQTDEAISARMQSAEEYWQQQFAGLFAGVNM